MAAFKKTAKKKSTTKTNRIHAKKRQDISPIRITISEGTLHDLLLQYLYATTVLADDQEPKSVHIGEEIGGFRSVEITV